MTHAICTGNRVVNDESRRALNQVNPEQYAAQPAQPSVTRAQVITQLTEAVRPGNVTAMNESGRKLNELFPNSYPIN